MSKLAQAARLITLLHTHRFGQTLHMVGVPDNFTDPGVGFEFRFSASDFEPEEKLEEEMSSEEYDEMAQKKLEAEHPWLAAILHALKIDFEPMEQEDLYVEITDPGDVDLMNIKGELVESLEEEVSNGFRKLIEQTGTCAKDWEIAEGEVTGVGDETWYFNSRTRTFAYICNDQGAITVEVYDTNERSPREASAAEHSSNVMVVSSIVDLVLEAPADASPETVRQLTADMLERGLTHFYENGMPWADDDESAELSVLEPPAVREIPEYMRAEIEKDVRPEAAS